MAKESDSTDRGSGKETDDGKDTAISDDGSSEEESGDQLSLIDAINKLSERLDDGTDDTTNEETSASEFAPLAGLAGRGRAGRGQIAASEAWGEKTRRRVGRW